jgi:hypothetical protein
MNDTFAGTDGRTHSVVPREPDAFMVVIFFSPDCHVLEAHDERVRRISADFATRGVRFLAVDSEIDASLERDRAEAARRGFSFPVVLDRDATLARSFGAEYSGYSVIVDREGAIRYRGGIDSDRVHLRGDATPYLSDALTDLLAGNSPRIAESKALGCALRLH